MKILVDVISHDATDQEVKAELLEDLKEYEVEVVETIKVFEPSLTWQGIQENIDRNRFLTNHNEDFYIKLRGASKLSRDFKTVIEAVSNEDIDVLFHSGRRELFVDDTLYEETQQLLRAILERYCDEGKNVMFKYPVEYIQNIMLSVSPFIQQYVPYTNEQGAHNAILGYYRKFAESFVYNEGINPNEIVTCHDALMTASRKNLIVKYLKSNAYVQEFISMDEVVNAGVWENYNDNWRKAMKHAIPKFSKNILNRKIKFIN